MSTEVWNAYHRWYYDTGVWTRTTFLGILFAQQRDIFGQLRAVRECLPRFEHIDNFWLWQRPLEA